MAIDIGDAILTFLADTSQLDAAFNRVGAEAATKMAPTAAAVQSVEQGFAEVGATAAIAGAAGQAAGHAIEEGAEVSRKTIHEAKGEAGLLGEMFGIHLPRHVRSFVAEIPAVATVLSSAFAATAILFLIEALAKAIEKIIEWRHEGERIAEAWEKVDDVQRKVFDNLEDKLIKAQIRLDELDGKTLEALRLKLQLIDRQTLEHLQEQIKQIGDEADKAMGKLDRGWVTNILAGFEGSEEAKAKLHDLDKTLKTAFETRTPEAYANALAIVQKALTEADAKVKELTEAQKNFKPIVVQGFVSPGPDPKTLESWVKLSGVIRDYQKDIEEARKAADKEKESEGAEDRKKRAEEAEKAREKERRALEQFDRLVTSQHQKLNEILDKQDDERLKHDLDRLQQGLKQEQKVSDEKLQQQREVLAGQIATIDGELQALRSATEQKAILLKTQYDKGLISQGDYLAHLKRLYDEDLQKLIAVLDRKQQLVIQEAQIEATQRGRILTSEDARELKAYRDIENQKKKAQDDFTKDFLKQQDQIEKRAAHTNNSLIRQLQQYSQHLRASSRDLHGWAKTADGILNDVSQAFGSAVEQWILGQESFGVAMERALAQYLARVAAQAAIDAIYFTARGFAALASWDFSGATNWFTAAAIAGGVAGAAGAAAHAINPGSGGSKTEGNPRAGINDNSPATQSGGQPAQQRNVASFAAGALVSTPTLAIVGDSRTGGRAREGVLPLDDPEAMGAIVEALGGGRGSTNFYVQGLVSADELRKLVRKIDRQVSRGQSRLTARNAYRVTRRG